MQRNTLAIPCSLYRGLNPALAESETEILRSVRTAIVGCTFTFGTGISLSRVTRWTDWLTMNQCCIIRQEIVPSETCYKFRVFPSQRRHMHKRIADQNHIIWKKIILKRIDQDVRLTDIRVSLFHILDKTKSKFNGKVYRCSGTEALCRPYGS